MSFFHPVLVLLVGIIVSIESYAQDLDGGNQKTELVDPSWKAQLFPNMGPYQRRFSTASDEAQAYLNQGMVWLHAFNHDEAIRSFLKAAELDPQCAWAWWGVAYCEGPNYNDPKPDANRSRAAWYALQNALARLGNASEVERDLILALQSRYANPWPNDRSKLEKAYADAMAKVWERHPQDADVGALYAESMMQLHPWALYSKKRQPIEGTLKIRGVLEKVMQLAPDHAGAKHLYIHAVEPSAHPEAALAVAQELNDLVPASGHLMHMPSHIYIQTGDWQAAIDQNIKAVDSDIRYRRISPNQAMQLLYQAHNAHMLTFAAMMVGQESTAMKYAKKIWDIVPENEIAAKGQAVDFSYMCVYDVQKRFGRWQEILEMPEPPESLLLTTAYWRAHRAIAFAAQKKFYEAEEEYVKFLEAKTRFPKDDIAEGTFNHRVLEVSQQFIRGEIAIQKKDWPAAIWHLEKAAEIEDTLRYTEPPYWLQPVRHALGAVCLKSGDAAKAEEVYRQDLKVWKDNGWSLLGLSKALQAQGRDEEASQVLTKFEQIWSGADTKELTTSCLCIEDVEE